jgi:hypothetical protein
MNTMPTNPQSALLGAMPDEWCDSVAVDGDALPFSSVPAGSTYHRLDRTNKLSYRYEKRKEDNHDDDWGALGGLHVLAETFTRAQMTDGGATTGTFVFAETIPVGAVVLRTLYKGITGFTGDTSAVLTIGDGSDVDRYNTGTPNVFITDTSVDAGAVSGTAYHDAAATVTATITSGSDFALVTAGRVSVFIFYLL